MAIQFNGGQFISFTPDTQAERVKLYNAINNPDKRVKEMINTPIELVDVVISEVILQSTFQDGKGGDSFTPPSDGVDTKKGYRVVLIDKDGKSYQAVSAGIYSSIKNIEAVFGGLHFEEPLTVIPRDVKTKNGNTVTLQIG